ncbi:MAG: hypothetical protein CMB74_02545 [Euryarchaeota archaeon]|nr:hypothetical protein [Euryarchaeota archaeon]
MWIIDVHREYNTYQEEKSRRRWTDETNPIRAISLSIG